MEALNLIRKLFAYAFICLSMTYIFAMEQSTRRLPSLPESDKQELPAKVLDYSKDFLNSSVLNRHAARELNLVLGKDDSLNSNLLNAIDRTNTWYGREALKVLLVNPLTKEQEDQLLKRQTLIKRLKDSPELLADFQQIFSKIAKHQENIFLLWSLANPFQGATDVQAYLGQLTGANKSKYSMELIRYLTNAGGALISTLLGYKTSINSYRVAYCWFNPEHKITWDAKNRDMIHHYLMKLGMWSGLSALWFLKVVRPVIDAERVNRDMQELMISVGETVNSSEDLVRKLDQVEGSEAALKYAHNLREYAANSKELNSKLRLLLNELKSKTFKGKSSSLSFMGRVRLAYEYLAELKNELIPLLKAIGEIDAYVSTARLIVEYKDKPVKYSLTEFVNSSDAPILVVDQSWNPLIKSNHKTESIALGTGENLIPNILLTGPHGGGKSTFMKQIAYSVVLSQVFGIAPATSCKMTLFSMINSYMDIKDNPEKGKSTFMAEKARIRDLKLKIRSLQDGQFGFTVIDEPFKATMEDEASILVNKFITQIEQVSENICIMASHFIKPAVEAEKRDHARFVNYHMKTEEKNLGRFTRHFKLENGKCDWWFDDQKKRARYVDWLQSVAIVNF